MKRELKFRLYFHDKELNRLQYSTHKFEVTDKQLHIMLARFDENTIKGFVQFTGLLDKTGKEIYEGDVVKLNDDFENTHTTTVEYKEGGFVVEWDNAFYDGADMTTVGWAMNDVEIEVIGNIYSNPELVSSSENTDREERVKI